MSPRTQRQFQEIREEKKALIMEAALEQFANEGYFQSTINQISKKAGISKGLMYNYFESKEALLKAIIEMSVKEMYQYLDINRDGYLSEDEFEFFLRKINVILTRNRHFWRLILQLLMQNDVKNFFMESFSVSGTSVLDAKEINGDFPFSIRRMFTEYFLRKKEKMDNTYDPEAELEFFKISLMGYTLKTVYSESQEAESDGKEIDYIIKIFK